MFEACKFLPREGTQTVTVSGLPKKVSYPGYDEALTAILGQFDGLASPPKNRRARSHRREHGRKLRQQLGPLARRRHRPSPVRHRPDDRRSDPRTRRSPALGKSSVARCFRPRCKPTASAPRCSYTTCSRSRAVGLHPNLVDRPRGEPRSRSDGAHHVGPDRLFSRSAVLRDAPLRRVHDPGWLRVDATSERAQSVGFGLAVTRPATP